MEILTLCCSSSSVRRSEAVRTIRRAKRTPSDSLERSLKVSWRCRVELWHHSEANHSAEHDGSSREQQSPCVAAVTAHYSEHRHAADVPLKII